MKSDKERAKIFASIFLDVAEFCTKNTCSYKTVSEFVSIAFEKGYTLGFSDAKELYKIDRDKIRGEE
jgi:hypothetical protein